MQPWWAQGNPPLADRRPAQSPPVQHCPDPFQVTPIRDAPRHQSFSSDATDGDGGDEDDGWVSAARSTPLTPHCRPASGPSPMSRRADAGSDHACTPERSWPLPAAVPTSVRSSGSSCPLSPKSPPDSRRVSHFAPPTDIASRLVACVLASLTLPDWAAHDLADSDVDVDDDPSWRDDRAVYGSARKSCPSVAGLAVESIAPAAFARNFLSCGVGTVAEFRSDWLAALQPQPEPTRGKSPSVFVASPSRRFLLKTIRGEEAQGAQRLLPSYFRHLAPTPGGPPSLLVPCLGLHYAVFGQWRQPFMVMANVMPVAGPFDHLLPCTAVFDLKGSTQRRRAGDLEQRSEVPVLKDGDFREWGGSLPLPKDQRVRLTAALASDCEWLQRSNVMDYSLLLCKCECAPGAPLPKSRPGLAVLRSPAAGLTGSRDAVYLCGLIDYWQDWNWRKRVEAGVRHQMVSIEAAVTSERAEPSCVPPAEYASRLCDFVARCFSDPCRETRSSWTWHDQQTLDAFEAQARTGAVAADDLPLLAQLRQRKREYVDEGVRRLKASAPRRVAPRRSLYSDAIALVLWWWSWVLAVLSVFFQPLRRSRSRSK